MYSEEDNPWFTKDRSESLSTRFPRTLNNINISNPALGLNIYESAISKEDVVWVINTLEETLSKSSVYGWSEAMVTTSDKPVKAARNCYDFKFNDKTLGPKTEKNSELFNIYEKMYNIVKMCVDDYANYWGINVCYYEAFNFVKYEGQGQEFKIHSDHGPHYNTTVSIVVYLNDDYEGGEIQFPRLDNLTYAPKIGDIAVFPSNYIYEHASLPMKSGTKYCIVIMSDINLLGHQSN
jgi:hypothetical protein